MIIFNNVWNKVKKFELVQVHREEMEVLYTYCFKFKRPMVVEIGSAHGASSVIFAQAIKELGGRLLCVDNFVEGYYSQEKFGDYARQAFKKNVLTEYSDCVELLDMSSSEAAKIYAGAAIDVLFIDGDHSYEGVRQDCEDWLKWVHPLGYAGFHDYNNVGFSGVKKAADEYCGTWLYGDKVWDLMTFRKP